VAQDLNRIFSGCRPEVVYLHNPADKHDTHVAVLLRCLEAIRRLPAEQQPGRVLGCEVWRDLDWLPDDRKVPLDAGRHPELALQLLAAFDSQIGGGKRYDLATLGRRSANAVFHASHGVDGVAGITWAMDLAPLVKRPGGSVEDFIQELIGQFQADVRKRLRSFGGNPGTQAPGLP
jgi:LmbE family N-acetylglucosaminyl deacetylase